MITAPYVSFISLKSGRVYIELRANSEERIVADAQVLLTRQPLFTLHPSLLTLFYLASLKNTMLGGICSIERDDSSSIK